MLRKEPIGSVLLALLFMGLGKAGPNFLEPRPRPCLRVLVSTALVCILAFPFCSLMAWVWMHTKELSFLYGLSQAFGLTAGPYLVWLAAAYCILYGLARRKRTKSAGVLLDEASRFCVPYLFVWLLPVGWPFVMMFVWFGLLPAPWPNALGYYLFCGVPLLFVAFGITLLLLGPKTDSR